MNSNVKAILIFCGALLLCLSLIAVTYQIFPVPAKASEFGDSFGMVNAIISALAFGGIIYAISLQREDLKTQKEDFELNREEIKQTNETLKLQRAEMASKNETARR